MFEKSLYDLIRGMRNHKGREKEYIQNSLRECRTEIKSQDMDLKATALLKLVYLEMFGNDMSWASFHVLEVMSSPKYLQKRVGYLAAVQSFGPKTDVLMLATNLLKKDLTSPLPTTMALPLATIPHIITSSLALSLLSDLLPRLNHSHPAIRKKTIVTLYRLALVYPETLRPAWPKIKERLMDETEDLTVTVAIVNVVCELGWRRPQDFLSMAPRLFDLLVDAGNNWMAIKIIKLFATLTPLEPRLVRKLLPPLTNIIQTTPAMSLLYECINGIIQGGILQSAEGTSEGEEIASLCVGKLRGMIATEDDRNLKYVALLAFHKIVTSHVHLVSLHQDVILDCVDDADISIRLRALDLVVGMVDRESLQSVVGRLMRQLRNSPMASNVDDPSDERQSLDGVQPAADSDDEDPEEALRPVDREVDKAPPLPADYRISAIERILEMCSRDTYANLVDFDWYIDVLVQLVRLAPAPMVVASTERAGRSDGDDTKDHDISYGIGSELRNVAVRVKGVRAHATNAAEGLLLVGERERIFASSAGTGKAVLGPAAWIVGEYASFLTRPSDTLDSLLHPSSAMLSTSTIATYLQAIPKVFAAVTGARYSSWTPERKSMTSLLIARVINFLETLTSHSSLEVQERSVEFIELMRLAAEAVSNQDTSVGDDGEPEAPLILTQVTPSLFQGLELNPVARGAQRKVPLPEGLDLESPLNPNLQRVLHAASLVDDEEADYDEFQHYYQDRPVDLRENEPAANRLKEPDSGVLSYQQSEAHQSDPEILAKRRAERRERNKDDPFYIPNDDDSSEVSTPFQNILGGNGADLDIDSIPIMELDLDTKDSSITAAGGDGKHHAAKATEQRKFEITVDENISLQEGLTGDQATREDGLGDESAGQTKARRTGKKSILQVDSSGLGEFSFEGDDFMQDGKLPDAQRQAEVDAEMAKAVKEVERLRLEMQRASERIQAAKGVPPEGTLIKKKKKKKPKVTTDDGPVEASQAPLKTSGDDGGEPTTVVKIKKKKKKRDKAVGIRDEPEGHGQGDEAVGIPQ